MTAFNASVALAVKTAKDTLLLASIDAKKLECEHFEAQVAIETTVQTLVQKCEARYREIRRLIPTLSSGQTPGPAVTAVLVTAEENCDKVKGCAAQILGRVMELVRSVEDAKLANAISKMDIAKAAADKAPEALPTVDKSALAKEIAKMVKKDLQGNNVSDSFFSILNLYSSRRFDDVEAALQEVWRLLQAQGRRQGSTREEQRQREIHEDSQEQRQASRAHRPPSEGGQSRRPAPSRQDQGEALWQICQGCEVIKAQVDSDYLRAGVEVSAEWYVPLLRMHHLLTTRINFFDSNTYPDCITNVDLSIVLNVLFLSAPNNLLGSLAFRKSVHKYESLEVPKYVDDLLSAGARYLHPQHFDTELVLKAWDSLVPVMKRDWDNLVYMDEYNVFHIAPKREFLIKQPEYSIDIPVPPFTRGPVADCDVAEVITQALESGRSELVRMTQEAPKFRVEARTRGLAVDEAFEWLTDNRVLVKQTDKNLGTVLVPVDWYEEKVLDHLRNTPCYQPITENHAYALCHNKLRKLNNFVQHPCVKSTPQLAAFLLHKAKPNKENDSSYELNVPIFSAIPKIHKEVWSVRPIVPCFAVPQGPASEFLSAILKTCLGQFPTILTSSKELVLEMERINATILKQSAVFNRGSGLFLATGDVVGFYTNVDTKQARDIVVKLATKQLTGIANGMSFHPVFSAFVDGLFGLQQDDLVFKIILRDNVLWFVQSNGLAMGVAASPDIANLFAAYHESKFKVDFMNKCLIYKRYIDDIFSLIMANSRSHAEKLLTENVIIPGLEIKWDISDCHCVFLDLDITLNKKWPGSELRYSPYRKPFNNFERLPYITGHPDSMLKAAFKSEVYRMAVLSCNVDRYAVELTWLGELYYSRGYPAKVILGWIKRFKREAWSNRLKSASRVDEPQTKIWPLKSVMNPVWEDIVLSRVTDEMYSTMQRAVRCTIPDEVISTWMRRLVASQSKPTNLGDIANAHNRRILEYPDNPDILKITLGKFPVRTGVVRDMEMESSSDEEQDMDMSD